MFKNTLIALGALIILGIIVFSPQIFKSENILSISKAFKNIKSEDISEIEIGKDVKLSKNDNLWIIKSKYDYPADKTKTKNLVEFIKSAKFDGPVSSNPKKRKKFELDDKKGLLVKLKKDSPIIEFLIGKSGPDYVSSYIRLKKSNNIFSSFKNLKSIFYSKNKDWFERKIFTQLKKEEIQKLVINFEKKNFEFEQDDQKVWKIVKPADLAGKNAIKSKIEDYLNEIINMRMEDLSDPKKELKEYELDTPKNSIKLTLTGGENIALLIGKKDNKRFLIKTSLTNHIYQVAEYRFNKFKKMRKIDVLEKIKEKKPEKKKEIKTKTSAVKIKKADEKKEIKTKPAIIKTENKKPEKKENIKIETSKKDQVINIKRSENPHVLITTSMGDITIELFEKEAPISVKNFLTYVEEKYYNGLIFHRVIDGFMVQGGGFEPGLEKKHPKHEPIKNEADNGLKNNVGTVAMARTGVVDSATAQFFINVKDNDFLNHRDKTSAGYGYAVFGKVIKGMDVVNKIKAVKTTTTKGFQNVPVDDVIIKKITKL